MALGALVKSHAANCLIYAYELLKLYYKNNNNDNTQLQQQPLSFPCSTGPVPDFPDDL